MTQNKKNIIYCLMAVLITIFILHTVYSTIDKIGSAALSSDKVVEQFRDIETTGKKWLNGHFGILFRFKYLGNINWLIIPLLVYFFATVKKWERWQLALVFVWLSTAIFIGLKGYANFRYYFTLVPFTAAIILLLLWEFLKNKKKYVKILCFTFFTIICLYNIYHYFDVYRFFWDLRVSVKNPYFPYKLVNYLNTNNNINTIKDTNKGSNVYIINQPLFYYYTNKKGIDSHGPDAWQANKLFKKREGGRNRKRVFSILKGELNTRYILLRATEKMIYRTKMLTEFLDCECRLILMDKGWFLYKVREQSLENILRSPNFERIKVWYPKKKLSQNISPSLLKFFQQGQFEFDCYLEKYSKDNVLMVSNRSPDKDGRRKMNFGYEANRKGIKMGIPEGRYVHFIVKAAISPNLINRDNYIFISDFKESWESQKAFFSTSGWRTYLISKKVRYGCSRLVLAFRFSPESSEGRLRIKDIKVAISEKPLE
jgi:hypothetical protein